MCRLLGYAAATPTSLQRLIGDPQLAQFASLSTVHGDGWGTSWLADGPNPGNGAGLVETHRSPSPAAGDPLFARHTETALSTARMVHLRWATPGFPVSLCNTHPFHAEGMSFAHNGSITPTAPLDDLLGPAELFGDTDSERYFAVIRRELQADPTAATSDAVLRTVTALRDRYPDASLNSVLLTATELVIVHANSLAAIPVDDLRALPGEPPVDHLSAYYLMRWRRTPDGSLLFVSSGLADQDWEPLPAESVTTVDLQSLTMRTRSLTAAEVRPAPEPVG